VTTHSHFREVCARHGTVISQCRCPGPKADLARACPGSPPCPEDLPDSLDELLRALAGRASLVTITRDQARAIVDDVRHLRAQVEIYGWARR